MKSGRRHSTLSFVVILALTVLVWFAVAMSEVREYPVRVKVEMTGFDRNQYAVVQADSMVTLQVEATGFSALLYGLTEKPVTLKINMRGENVRTWYREGEAGKLLCRSVSVDDLGDRLANDLSGNGMRQIGSAKDSLRLVLAERKSKVFRVDISDVNVSFAEGYGLYGEPLVSPAEVTLYGDEESLSRIERVRVMPVNIKGLTKSGAYMLSLDTAWRNNDVYASTDKVTLRVSVEQYVEREYTLPIEVSESDSLTRLNLYPDKVQLRVWVPRRDIASVTADRFSVAVDYRDVTSRASKLKVRLNRFPQTVRIHSLTPEEVKYVVIK